MSPRKVAAKKTTTTRSKKPEGPGIEEASTSHTRSTTDRSDSSASEIATVTVMVSLSRKKAPSAGLTICTDGGAFCSVPSP